MLPTMLRVGRAAGDARVAGQRARELAVDEEQRAELGEVDARDDDVERAGHVVGQRQGALGRELLAVVDERDRLRQREQPVLVAHPHRPGVGERPGRRSRRERGPVDGHLAAAFEQRQIAGGGDGAAGLVGGGLEPEPVVGVGDRGLQSWESCARTR